MLHIIFLPVLDWYRGRCVDTNISRFPSSKHRTFARYLQLSSGSNNLFPPDRTVGYCNFFSLPADDMSCLPPSSSCGWDDVEGHWQIYWCGGRAHAEKQVDSMTTALGHLPWCSALLCFVLRDEQLMDPTLYKTFTSSTSSDFRPSFQINVFIRLQCEMFYSFKVFETLRPTTELSFTTIKKHSPSHIPVIFYYLFRGMKRFEGTNTMAGLAGSGG